MGSSQSTSSSNRSLTLTNFYNPFEIMTDTRKKNPYEIVASRFCPDDGIAPDDEEFLCGLDFHGASYLILEYDTNEIIFVSSGMQDTIDIKNVKKRKITDFLHETIEISSVDASGILFALENMNTVVVPFAGKITGQSDLVSGQLFISPLKNEYNEEKYVICSVDLIGLDQYRADLTRSLAYRIWIAKNCKKKGEGKHNATSFQPHKPLCQNDISLVETLINRAEMFCITDPSMYDNPIVYVSDDFMKMTGYSRSEINGINCRFLQGIDTSPEDVDEIRRAINECVPTCVRLLNYRKNGVRFANQFNLSPLYDNQGNLAYFIGVQIIEELDFMVLPSLSQKNVIMYVEKLRDEISLVYKQKIR